MTHHIYTFVLTTPHRTDPDGIVVYRPIGVGMVAVSARYAGAMHFGEKRIAPRLATQAEWLAIETEIAEHRADGPLPCVARLFGVSEAEWIVEIVVDDLSETSMDDLDALSGRANDGAQTVH